jgi:hypothetical protein
MPAALLRPLPDEVAHLGPQQPKADRTDLPDQGQIVRIREDDFIGWGRGCVVALKRSSPYTLRDLRVRTEG